MLDGDPHSQQQAHFVPAHGPASQVTMKRRIQRRYGACEPCRASKTKCDGRLPCSACRSERKRQSPCVYSEKVRALQRVSAELRRRTDRVNHQSSVLPVHFQDQRPQPDTMNHRTHNQLTHAPIESAHSGHNHEQLSQSVNPAAQIQFQNISLLTAVEEFKKLKPTRGVTAQIISKCSGFEGVDQGTSLPQPTSKIIDNYDRQQQLDGQVLRDERPAIETEMSHLCSKLNRVEFYITNSQLTRAWIDLASVLREAETLQVYFGNPGVATGEACTAWRDLWKRVLDLESQLGLLLGRPTCAITVKTDRSQVDPELGQLRDDSLDATRIDLYQHIQSIVALNTRPTSIAVSDHFLERARDVLMHEPFSQVGLCTTEEHTPAARNLQLNTHLLFTVVYLRLAAMCDVYSPHGKGFGLDSWSGPSGLARRMHLHQPRQKMAYVRKMLRSAQFVINTFMSLCSDYDKTHIRSIMISCHGVFVAAVLVGIAKLRHEIEWKATTELLQKLERVFLDLSNKEPDYPLFSVILARLRDLNLGREPRPTSKDKKYDDTPNNIENDQVGTTSEQASPDREASTDSEPASSRTIEPSHYKKCAYLVNQAVTSFGSSQQHTSDDELYDTHGDEYSFPHDASAYYSSFGSMYTGPSDHLTSAFEPQRQGSQPGEVYLGFEKPSMSSQHPQYGSQPDTSWAGTSPVASAQLRKGQASTQKGPDYSQHNESIHSEDESNQQQHVRPQPIAVIQHQPLLPSSTTSPGFSSQPLPVHITSPLHCMPSKTRSRVGSRRPSSHTIEAPATVHSVAHAEQNRSQQQPQSGVLIPKGSRDHLSFYSISHPQQNLWQSHVPVQPTESFILESPHQFLASQPPVSYGYGFVYNEHGEHALPVYHS